MKEVVQMWKYSTMVALTVLCAGIYLLFLVPFKASLTLVPGFTEIRPASIFPILFGLLFGPAGAWGSALGNLAGDFFGTLSIGSIFGFAGNFFLAYFPYKIWGRLRRYPLPDQTPTINTPRKLADFGLVSVLSSIACAVVIAWGNDLLKQAPYAVLSTIITLNNSMIALVLGPVLLPFLYPRVKRLGLLWTDIMHPRDRNRPNPDRVYILLFVAGSLGGLLFGLASSVLFAGQTILHFSLSAGGPGSLITGFVVLPFLVSLIYGAVNA